MFSSVLPMVVGGAAGFAWYRLVGCTSGGCILGSTWWSSMAYGAVMGYLAKMSLFD